MTSEINPAEICSSVFQTRPLANCSVLSKCEESLLSKASAMANNNQRLPAGSINFSVSSTSNSNNNSNNKSSSPKMGSRRIFTPQFKLQVLESYRCDSDCKGNQRATARKYNIHRRQIQKWLQCESNLRSSVANINQNSVKHQFHNISPNHPHHHHHQQLRQHSSAQLQPTRMTMPIAVPSATHNNSNIGFSHPQHNHSRLQLDTECQTLAMNSLSVPSMPNLTTTKGVLAANLAAAVAVAIASSSSPNTSNTPMSPLRPTANSGASGGSVTNTVSTISSSMLHSHHHHHFQLSPFASAPVVASVPVSVPMLTHHIAAPAQTHALHHQHYPYNNLSPHTHPLPLPPLQLSHQPSAFMLTTPCLPTAVAVCSPLANTMDAATEMQEKGIEDNTHAEANAKLCEQSQDITTTTNKSTIPLQQAEKTMAAAAVLMSTTASSYTHDPEYECVYQGAMYADGDRMLDVNCKTAYHPPMLYRYTKQNNLQNPISSPMDLSLGSRKKRLFDSNSGTELPKTSTQMKDVNYNKLMYCSLHTVDNSTHNNMTTDVVDLTFRKRKVVTACSRNEQPQKYAKCLENGIDDQKSSVYDGALKTVIQSELNDDDDNVEIEIEVDVDAKNMSSKPIKLFKPYLLDDDVNEKSKSYDNGFPSHLNANEEREPIIWSNHPAFRNDASRASSLHSPTADKNTFPNGSPFFLASKTSSPQSVLSPASASSLSPTSFSPRCPKGSPVSGYESSSSTCSEREDTYSVTENQSFSLDFQMHAVCQERVTTLHKPIHIHEWLAEDSDAEKKVEKSSFELYV